MVHFKPKQSFSKVATGSKIEVILLSLTIYFLANVAAQKASTDVSEGGYLYDKPGKTLEVPKPFEDGETTDEIITKSPIDRPFEEYLPPRATSGNHTSKREDVHFRKLNDDKRELQKTKRKFVNQQQFPFQGRKGGDLKERFETKKEEKLEAEDESLLADEWK